MLSQNIVFRPLLITLATATSLYAQISAEFTTGQEGDPIGAYADVAGGGWNTPWLTKSNAGGPISRDVKNSAPLGGGGNYLRVSATQRGGNNQRSFIGLARQYAGSPVNGVSRKNPHTINFDFRLDECSGFNGDDDNITIGDASDTTTSSGIGTSSSFLIRAFGGKAGTAVPGKWAVYNGARNAGNYDLNRFVDTGMDLRVGVMYNFTIKLNPSEKSYTVTISEGGKSYTSPAMGYRGKEFGNGVLAFIREGASGDYTSFSLDSISIIPATSDVSGTGGTALAVPVQVVAKSVTVGLDANTTFQKFAGFGASTAWHEAELGKDDGKLFRELFDTSGLALDFLRVPNDYVKDAKNEGELKTADMIKKFRSLRPAGKVLMSSWSPPKEFKTTKSLVATRSAGGTLDAALLDWECYNLSRWWVESLKYFDAEGALPDYMSIQNEPDFLNQAWPTCIVKPKLYADTLDWVTKELNWNGWAYKLFVVGPETSSLANFSGYKQAIDTKQLRAYAVHPYDRPSEQQWQDFSAANADKPVFMTEYDGETDLIGSASDIHRALVHGQVSAYFAWSVVNFPKDPPDTGLFDLSSGARQQKYYSLAHFSRWIRRDDTRIKAVAGNGDVLVTAFKRANGVGDAFRYAIVLINKSSSAQDVLLEADTINKKTVKAFVTSYAEGRYLQEATQPQAGPPKIQLPPQSIATVLINW